MIYIKNDYDEYFCDPITREPFVFESYEEALKFIDKMGLKGAHPEEERKEYD